MDDDVSPLASGVAVLMVLAVFAAVVFGIVSAVWWLVSYAVTI